MYMIEWIDHDNERNVEFRNTETTAMTQAIILLELGNTDVSVRPWTSQVLACTGDE